MNFFSEGVEELRFATTKEVMEAMAKLAADESAKPEDRIKAAKVVDGMSDSIIKAMLMTNVVASEESKSKQMMRQLDQLTDKNEP